MQRHVGQHRMHQCSEPRTSRTVAGAGDRLDGDLDVANRHVGIERRLRRPPDDGVAILSVAESMLAWTHSCLREWVAIGTRAYRIFALEGRTSSGGYLNPAVLR